MLCTLGYALFAASGGFFVFMHDFKLGFSGEPPHPFAGAKWDMGPTSAGASLIDNKHSKLLNHKPNGLKSFEGSLRETFQKVPLKKKLKFTDKSKFEHLYYAMRFFGSLF